MIGRYYAVMVYPHETILLRFNGHFGTSGNVLDRWSCGMRFGFPNKGTLYDTGKLQTFVNSAKTAAATFHAAAGAGTGTFTWLDNVTGAQVGTDGKYVPPTQLTTISPITPVQGGGGANFPWNTALVISLRTAVPRGRGSNGRIYWPAVGMSVDANTGRVGPTVVDSRMTLAKTFLDALNTAANTYDTAMHLVVASNVGGGLVAPVTSIRSDERLDSIERRENQSAAVYHALTLA